MTSRLHPPANITVRVHWSLEGAIWDYHFQICRLFPGAIFKRFQIQLLIAIEGLATSPAKHFLPDTSASVLLRQTPVCRPVSNAAAESLQRKVRSQHANHNTQISHGHVWKWGLIMYCIYMYIHIHKHTRTYTHKIYIYNIIYEHMYVYWICTYTRTHIHTRNMHTYSCIHSYLHMYIFINFKCVCGCMYVMEWYGMVWYGMVWCGMACMCIAFFSPLSLYIYKCICIYIYLFIDVRV